jgi:hypothetical protein
MNEHAWLASTDPAPMLEFLQGKASDRKLRLFACACCRMIRWWDPQVEFLRTVETAERFADGATTKAELKRARQSVRKVRHLIPARVPERHTEWVALWLAEVTASENAFGKVAHEIQRLGTEGLISDRDQPPCIALLHDIFGNPFRPVTFDPAWLTSNVITLAQTIYNDRAFERLPELGDALEAAGCDNQNVLDHCRNDGPHVRGCWVVDLVLGKR